MKKFYSLLAVAVVASMSTTAFAEPVTEFNDDQYFTMNLLDPAGQNADQVTIEFGAHIEKDNIALLEFYMQNPDGCQVLEDPDELEDVVVAGYEEGWALPKFTTSNCQVQTARKMDDRDILVILNHPHKSYRNFAAGDIKVCKITIDASALKIGEGEGPNKNNFYTTIPGHDQVQVLLSGTDDVTYCPETAVQLKLAVQEDGKITGVETIRTNDTTKKGIYNMMGQRVRVAEPGQVYIINGQKVIPTETISE
ncbi:MAG: hypothetical protein J6X70_03070 [Muribaculaceae bacterium]|nr:hypothetical protein [Muribaculaceae bacterium]